MIVPPPLLPELDGGRPAASSLGSATATIRLGAQVVAIKGADALIETAQGRALLQGAPALRPGMTVVLELQHTDPALPRPGHLVAVDDERLEHALPVRLRPAPLAQAAATVRAAAALEVSVRPVGPDGRSMTPALIARLSVPPPEPGSASPGSSPALPSGGAAARSTFPLATGSPAGPVTPTNNGTTQPTSWLAAGLAQPAAPGPATAATGPPVAPAALLGHLGALAAQGRALEAVVLPRDALGRTLLRAAGLTLQVDTPLDLPPGSRLQLSLPAEPARSGVALLQAGPLDAVRTLATWLRAQPEMAEPARAGAPRLPEPDATLASRLLRLVQLIAPRPRSADVPRPAGPAVTEARPGMAPVTRGAGRTWASGRGTAERWLASAAAAARFRGGAAPAAVCA